MMLYCFDFLLCFSRELGRSRWSRFSRAFAKAVNELLHIQFQWVLIDTWLIQKLKKSLSSLKSKTLIIRCDCPVVVCGPGRAIIIIDHVNLKMFLLNKNLFEKEMKWWKKLFNLNWIIKYKSEKQNSANTTSRRSDYEIKIVNKKKYWRI